MVAELNSIDGVSASTNLFNQSSFKSEAVQRFQYWFDHYCKYAFFNCMNNYNNYSQPLIAANNFMNYLQLSKRIFPQQWNFLAGTCNIQVRDGNELNEFKERQIFMILLNLQRLTNFRCLKQWAMVISTAYYGWGAKDTTGHVTSFLGITVARTIRDAFFKQLTVDRVQSFCSLLASHCSGLMVWNNFQQGQEREQHGGQSSKFLIGTVEVAHGVVLFLNFRWDDCCIFIQYDENQACPSPLGMRAYKSVDPSSRTYGTDVFLNHCHLHVPDSPCFSGVCVQFYEDNISLRKYICDMSRAFSRLFKLVGAAWINTDHIATLNEYCSCKATKDFYSSVYKFQWQAVLDWNPSADSVTMSFNMGFVGIREDSSAGAGSVVLDMLLKFRLLKYNEDELWELE
jgi:hypothetical protein